MTEISGAPGVRLVRGVTLLTQTAVTNREVHVIRPVFSPHVRTVFRIARDDVRVIELDYFLDARVGLSFYHGPYRLFDSLVQIGIVDLLAVETVHVLETRFFDRAMRRLHAGVLGRVRPNRRHPQHLDGRRRIDLLEQGENRAVPVSKKR